METRKTSLLPWQCKLRDRLQHLKTQARDARVVVVGVGNALLGDDALGVTVARRLHASGRVTAIDAGIAPENVTGRLRALRPDLVLLIDAVQLDLPPGSIEWFDSETIVGCSAMTHSLPLDVFAHYVETEMGCKVDVIGIQPQSLELDDSLSRPVQRSVRQVVRELRQSLGSTNKALQ